MPQHHVQRLEIRAVKLQHRHPSQARQRPRHQSGRHGIHCKTAPEQQPARERRRNRVEQARGQAHHPLSHEVLGAVIAEQDRKNTEQRQAAGRQQGPRTHAAPAAGNHLAHACRGRKPNENTQTRERSARAPGRSALEIRRIPPAPRRPEPPPREIRTSPPASTHAGGSGRTGPSDGWMEPAIRSSSAGSTSWGA